MWSGYWGRISLARAFYPATHIKLWRVQTCPESCGGFWFGQPKRVARGRAGLTSSAPGSSPPRCRSHCRASAERPCCRSATLAMVVRSRTPDAGWLIRRESGSVAKTELGLQLARIMDGALTFLDNVAARGRGNLRCSHGRPPLRKHAAVARPPGLLSQPWGPHRAKLSSPERSPTLHGR
jgi:hypothetical protein